MRLSSEVSAHPLDQAEDSPFPLETKTPLLRAPGDFREIKNGINSSSGNPPFKIICLAHCSMKTASEAPAAAITSLPLLCLTQGQRLASGQGWMRCARNMTRE